MTDLSHLTGQALWHTPSAADGTGGHAYQNGTSVTGVTPDGRKVNTSLPHDVRFLLGSDWPTPAARDYRSGSGAEENGHTRQLPEVVGGVLNPAWVEILMGFPAGWTDLRAITVGDHPGWPSLPHEPQHDYEPSRTVASKTVDRRAARLRMLGNAVVQQQAAPLFAVINALEEEIDAPKV